MIVDFAFYALTYKPEEEVCEASFPALCARAEDVIGAMTHWRVSEGNINCQPEAVRTLYRKAVCAQIESFAVNGTESASNADGGRGWTVGKVSVSGKSSADITRKGALASAVSPLAIAYLEQTGLMNPAVDVVKASPDGWWF